MSTVLDFAREMTRLAEQEERRTNLSPPFRVYLNAVVDNIYKLDNLAKRLVNSSVNVEDLRELQAIWREANACGVRIVQVSLSIRGPGYMEYGETVFMNLAELEAALEKPLDDVLKMRHDLVIKLGVPWPDRTV